MDFLTFVAKGLVRVERRPWRFVLIFIVLALAMVGRVLAEDDVEAASNIYEDTSCHLSDTWRQESRREALAMGNSSGLTILQPNLVSSTRQVLKVTPGLAFDSRNDNSSCWCGATVKNLSVPFISEGTRRPLPMVYQSGSFMTKMSSIVGMGPSPNGSHLLLSTDVSGEDLYSRVPFLSVLDGNRTSYAQPAAISGSLTLNPAKTQVYLSDMGRPTRVLTAPFVDVVSGVAGVSPWTTVASFSRGGQPNISTVHFNHQSFASDGSCLYFVDRAFNRVWAMGAASGEVTLVAGTGESGVINGDGGNATFRGLRDILVTPDGCNLFVSEIGGRIRWITLEAPCGQAKSVETIVRYPDGGLWGLALKDEGTQLKLYAGGNEGSIFELPLVKAAWHVCGGSSGQGGGSPPPLPSATTPDLH
ncbi:hypothetical protein CBR_g22088 [Chara braunii]|uniref:SMP-30/Gluconolactonase/LRE-like region domain-containing protein n=1 Tax=Chara braunii TaxID=69332 RepID=A0A388L220_CHABU|nr:hypothetical protein CBR_g22088 [Chara braunii]|eukprot:GBG76341.1 hypothetical protein CBR_g22088 [Chara braunii]